MNDESLGRHNFVKLTEVKLHCVEAGSRHKPLMLFLHGFPECWFSWRYQIRQFKAKYRVVAVDMRGHGESEKPTNVADYFITRLSDDSRELIPALGYEKCVLVTHDWGCLVGFDFTTRHPDMVEKLIVCNAPHPKSFEEVINKSWKQFLMSWYVFGFLMPGLPEVMLKINDFALLSGYSKKLDGAPKAACDKDEVDALKYSLSIPGGLTGGLNYYRAFGRYKLPSYYDNGIRVPTLIIWGLKDVALSRASAEASFKYIHDLKVHWIESTGHNTGQEDPDTVNEIMEDFLA